MFVLTKNIRETCRYLVCICVYMRIIGNTSFLNRDKIISLKIKRLKLEKIIIFVYLFFFYFLIFQHKNSR